MATPCDGIVECRDGQDEDCEDDKLIFIISVALLFLTTTCIYLYIVFVRLPLWKKSIFRDFDDGNMDLESRRFDCSGLKGIKLAKLKVIITKSVSLCNSQDDTFPSFFRMIYHKSNVLKHWLKKDFSPRSRR